MVRLVRKRNKKIQFLFTLKINIPDSPSRVLNQTRRRNIKSIEILSRHIGGVYALIADIDVRNLTANFSVKNELWSLFIRYNQVLSTTLQICAHELQAVMFQLQTGVYGGAARTLRYVLETSVSASAFQSERDRPTLTMLREEHRAGGKEKIQQTLMTRNAWASFVERYRLYDNRRMSPTFAEQVNELNSREFFRLTPELASEIKSTYETLSDYVHLSSVEIKDEPKPGKLYGIRYDPQQFDLFYNLSLKVTDYIQYVYLNAMSRFCGFQKVEDFLRDMSQRVQPDNKVGAVFLKLPFCQRLWSNVTWTKALTKLKTRPVKVRGKESSVPKGSTR